MGRRLKQVWDFLFPSKRGQGKPKTTNKKIVFVLGEDIYVDSALVNVDVSTPTVRKGAQVPYLTDGLVALREKDFDIAAFNFDLRTFLNDLLPGGFLTTYDLYEAGTK